MYQLGLLNHVQGMVEASPLPAEIGGIDVIENYIVDPAISYEEWHMV